MRPFRRFERPIEPGKLLGVATGDRLGQQAAHPGSVELGGVNQRDKI